MRKFLLLILCAFITILCTTTVAGLFWYAGVNYGIEGVILVLFWTLGSIVAVAAASHWFSRTQLFKDLA